MGISKIKSGIILLLFFTSCNNFEWRGFITSYDDIEYRFQQSKEWNEQNEVQNIVVATDSYNINVMGDSHVGGTKNLDQFFINSQAENASAVVMVGDLTTGHKEDFDLLNQHLPDKNLLNQFPIVGNHDLYFDGWKTYYEMFGSSTYTFTVSTPSASDLFICLDTGGGTLGKQQLSWLKEVLQNQRGNFRYCTIFTHTNLFRLRPTTSTNPMQEELEVLLDLFLKNEVNMVVTGHDHSRNTDNFANTEHVIMDALQDISKNASYLKLIIDDTKIDYTFIDLN